MPQDRESVQRIEPTASPRRASAAYPKAVDRLIDEFAKLPGVGRRSAERLAFHVLKAAAPEALALAKAIDDVKNTVRHCAICRHLTDAEPATDGRGAANQARGPICAICADPNRDRGVVLVVEQPKDLIALEQTGAYRGVYHVLMGRISPLDGIGADEINAKSLLERVSDPERNPGGAPVLEVIMGMNPTLEGDGTGLYLAQELLRAAEGRPLKITRLARGVPTGSQLEFANKSVLADAIQCRQGL